jgi:hypothetical protein
MSATDRSSARLNGQRQGQALVFPDTSDPQQLRRTALEADRQAMTWKARGGKFGRAMYIRLTRGAVRAVQLAETAETRA